MRKIETDFLNVFSVVIDRRHFNLEYRVASLPREIQRQSRMTIDTDASGDATRVDKLPNARILSAFPR